MTVLPSQPGTASLWQPIETAPKDGTRLLCYWAPAVEGGEFARDIACWMNGDWCDPDDTETHYSEPDNWQPLPPPPEAT